MVGIELIKKKNGKLIHRDVALLPVNSTAYGKVKPVTHYKCGKQKDNLCIDLSGFQTPTIEYLKNN